MESCHLPGEIINLAHLDPSRKICLGNGIEKRGDMFVTCQPGLLRCDDNKTWVSVHSKRYIPFKGDRVIGIVTNKLGDFFKVDIGYSDLALINFLSFEGATKRNRPNLKTGDIIYAQVSEASPHLEPELTCIDSVSRAKGLGILTEGLMFKTPLHLARRMLSPKNKLMELLGEEFKFEITVGLNGRSWLKSGKPLDTMTLRRIILASEYVLEESIPKFVEEEIQKSKKKTAKSIYFNSCT
ncbi:unnamed protein product [Auanema sp. JU1783]|nr:unnamed protein product [Auanema sp. JU1783]